MEKGKWRGEVINISSDGNKIIFDCRTQVVKDDAGQPIALCGISTDVTDRRRAEKDLQEALMRQQEAVKAGDVGLWDWDLVTNNVNYSTEWKKQIGYEDNEICNDLEEWQSRVHPDDLDLALEQVQLAIKENRQDFQSEFRFRHKDGSYRWILARASVLQDEAGETGSYARFSCRHHRSKAC